MSQSLRSARSPSCVSPLTEPYERISLLIERVRAMPDSIEELRDHLQREWGLEFGRICHAIQRDQSAGAFYHHADVLVYETGLSHRAVGQVLSTADALHARGSRPESDYPRSIAVPFTRGTTQPARSWEDRAIHPTLPHLRTILSKRPAPDRRTDHIGATPITA